MTNAGLYSTKRKRFKGIRKKASSRRERFSILLVNSEKKTR
jgi:hypothetical protein